MALSSLMEFDVRTTGSDSNGGGFKAGATGTDWSQQDSSHATTTTATTVHTTTSQINVAAGDYTVANGDVGNVIQITGGTATAGFYEIVSVTTGATNRWALDRSCGTSGQTVVCKMGGALLSMGKASAAAQTSGQTIHIKSGSYSITSATNDVAGGCYSGSTQAKVIGYNSTHRDYGTRPVLTASGISSFTLMTTSTGCYIANIEFDGASLTSSRGISFGSGTIYKCKFSNFTNTAVIAAAATNGAVISSLFTGCATAIACRVPSAIDCEAYGNTSCPFDGNGSQATYINCLSYDNTGATTDGFQPASVSIVKNCIAYNNGRDGYRTSSAAVYFDSSLAISNGGTGFNCTSNTGTGTLFNCAYYNNTTANVTTAGAQLNFNGILLTGDPFVDAANHNFALNNTSGAGASCRAAGYPSSFPRATTSAYFDVGVQHQESGGGTRGFGYAG